MLWKMRILQTCAATWLLVPHVFSLPLVPDNIGINLTAFGLNPEGQTLWHRSLDNGVQLRILPLGASITWGYLSTDGNGYRYGLRNALVYGGNPVNMIGSVQHGDMADNDVEGWPGYVIDTVAQKAELSIPSQPNLVLLHVGTNDMGDNIDIPNAHLRLMVLVDHLFDTIPGVTVICSTLLPNGNAAIEDGVEIFNGNLPGVINARQAAGKKILLADMHSEFFSLSDIQSDGTHPTDAGYLKMAAVWYQAIQVASAANWLTPPASVSGVSDVITASSTCEKLPGNAIGPVKTQQGSGFDDGLYVHVGIYEGTMSGMAPNNIHAEGVYWADIDGDGTDDYVYVSANANSGFGVSLSLGSGNFGPYAVFAFDVYCLRRGVRFADMTGDGRDDFCCLNPNGDMTCWQNLPGSDARNPVWSIMSPAPIFLSKGYDSAHVRLADIDGDGRADYVGISDDGTAMFGWRNGALGNLPPAYWYAMSGVIDGLPVMSPINANGSGWQFHDLNGDHKDDLVHISLNGEVTTWINQRGYDVGLTPHWVSMGVTHGGPGVPTNVYFGAFWGSGKADYANVNEAFVEDAPVTILQYSNNDSGGTRVKGDGSRYCDMRGTGADDYIWISSIGEMTLYGNYHTPPFWNYLGVIGNVNRNRKEVHFADFDGDGRCDILLVDRSNGAAQMLRNDFDAATQKFTFTNIGYVTGGAAACTQGYGYDNNDLGVRFADIDGDGRADYLCLEPDGRMTGALNKGINNLVDQGQIKFSEKIERAHIHIADINGDGRADYLHVDMLTGEVWAWTNENLIVPRASGSAFLWIARGIVSGGNTARGSCINYGNLYGLGRADYIVVDPQANTAETWFNVCPNGGLSAVAPNLPAVPNTPPTIGSSGYYFGDQFVEHSVGYVRDSTGTPDPTTRDWCENVQGVDYYVVQTGIGASDLGWMSLHCDMPEIVNTGRKYTANERWVAADALNALLAMRICWVGQEQYVPVVQRGSWSQGVFNYFHGPDNQHCELVDGACDGFTLCTEAGHPAGFLVMNSFVTLHNIFKRLQATIDTVVPNELSGKADLAISTFSPNVQADPLKWLKLALDIVGIAFAVSVAPVWNIVLKEGAFKDAQNILGTIKDTTNSVVAGGINLIKDGITMSSTPNDAEARLKYMGSQLQLQYGTSNAGSLSQLFATDQDSWVNFVNLVGDGAMVDDLAYFNDTAQQSVISSLWATLIPYAWALSNEGYHPFIMKEDDIDDYFGCLKGDTIDTYIASDDQDKALNCVGQFPYYLVAAGTPCTTCAEVCVTAGKDGLQCTQNKFKLLPGIDQLIPETNAWGNVTRDQMVQGSLASFAVAGGNGYNPMADLANGNLDVNDKGLKGPGMFTFPVCSGAEAHANWAKDWDLIATPNPNPNYPCNP